MSMLQSHLKKAVEFGYVVTIDYINDRYSGTVIELDDDFVRVITCDVTSSPPISTCWILRVDAIIALCVAGNTWPSSNHIKDPPDEDLATGVPK